MAIPFMQKKKQSIYWRDIVIVVVILIIGFVLGLFVNVGSPEIVTTTGSDSIQALSTEGFELVAVDALPMQILLSSGCRELTMVTTESQTYSIATGAEGLRPFRPLTHDLIADVLDIYDMKVLLVKIESLEEGTYFAKLFVAQGNKILSLDSKPSDAIAIAVRTDAPVYLNQTLLEQEGEYLC